MALRLIETTPGHSARRGSAYLLTLIASSIVVFLGLAGLMAVRVEVRRGRDAGEQHQAHLLAITGLDMARYWVEHDADWRTKAAADDWDANTAFAGGTYRIAFTDPQDGDVADSIYDAVEVEATGNFGSCRERLRMRLDVTTPAFECLRSAVHAGNDIQFTGVTANADHWMTANHSIIASDGDTASQVYVDVAAAVEVKLNGASQIHGQTTTSGTWPLSMPDPAQVLSYYLANGTAINVSDIPTWGDNLLDNPGLEGPAPDPPMTAWFPVGPCTLAPDATETDAGSFSLRVNDRTTTTDGPGQSLMGKIANGLTYSLSVRTGSVNVDDEARINVTVTSGGSGVTTLSTPWKRIEAGKFASVEGVATPSWSGQLIDAVWHVETRDTTDDIRIDTATLVEMNPYPSVRTIHRQLISPQHNPFGTGQTNPEGIYVIDLQGEILSIQRSRVVGTLVILNGPTYVWAVVHWAPAVSNYPALLSDSDINFWLANFGDVDLDESMSGVNYNPPGTPFAGVSDTDAADTYSALMRGIVYSMNEVWLKHHPVLEGVIVADDDVHIVETDTGDPSLFEVTYLSHFYNEAPPGFRAAPVIDMSPGSIRRVVDP